MLRPVIVDGANNFDRIRSLGIGADRFASETGVDFDHAADISHIISKKIGENKSSKRILAAPTTQYIVELAHRRVGYQDTGPTMGLDGLAVNELASYQWPCTIFEASHILMYLGGSR